jgi:hypothetical protein
MKLSAVAFIGLVTASCATLSAQKGHGEAGSTGQVSYNPEGITEIVGKRRASALKKAAEFCQSGKFNVTGEKKVGKDDPLAGDDIATAGANFVTVIEFTCR